MTAPVIACGTGRNVLWHLDAACAGVDPELFYPLDLAPDGDAVAAAKRVCAGCPVRAQCLTEVMAGEDPARRWGITAGTTPAERVALYAAQRLPVVRPAVVAA